MLWWEEHWLDESALRSSLSSLANDSIAEFDGWRDQFGGAYGVADEIVKQLNATGVTHPLLRLLRYNIRGTQYDLDAVVYAIVLLAYGETPVWETPDVDADEADPDVRQVMERAIGFARAVQDKWGDVGPLIEEPADAPGLFERLIDAGVLPLTNLLTIPPQGSLEELNEARDHTRLLVENLGPIALALERRIGRGSFGLGVFALLARQTPDAKTLVLIILIMFALYRVLTDEERETFTGVREAIEEVAPMAREVVASDLRRQH